MSKKRSFNICPLCDEHYNPFGDRAKIHEHPEPQSGLPRDQWRQSGLDYDEWIIQTEEGRDWHNRNKAT